MSTRPTRTPADRRERRRRLARRALLVLAAAGLCAAWVWARTLPLAHVEVVGTRYARAADVVRELGLVPDSVALFAVSADLVAERAARHPWVAAATVRRLPSGTLRVRVAERVPVALALSDGEPSHFFDAAGYAMPADAATPVVADVPLLRGDVPHPAPGTPAESASLRELLAALAAADPATDALVSEIEWHAARPTLWTTPAGGHGAIAVRLGRTDYADQLARLRAFWDQSVLPRPDAVFRHVDLRFAGQVVTLEGDPPPPDSSRAAPAPAPASTVSL